jgi:hypothetical protein
LSITSKLKGFEPSSDRGSLMESRCGAAAGVPPTTPPEHVHSPTAPRMCYPVARRPQWSSSSSARKLQLARQVAQAVEPARSAPLMALPPDPNSVDGPPLDLLRRRLFYLDLLRKRVMGERGSWTGKPLRRGRRVERFVGRHGGSIGRNKKGRGTRPVGPTLRCGTHGQTSQTTLKTGQGPNEIDR